MNDRDPILVGVGQITQKVEDPLEALEPIDLMAEAARRAERDAGVSDLLAKTDSIRVMNVLSWTYGNAPGALAARLGSSAADTVYTTVGGNSPQLLVNETADEIARGEVRLALLAGAEAMASVRRARKARVEPRWCAPSGKPQRTIGDPRWGTHDVEANHGAVIPIQIYPLFENALRARRGWSLEEHRRRIGELFARFSRVAADNPYAWFRDPVAATDLMKTGADNRMIAFPYPKRVNSILDVDQGAAVLMTSARVARELGIPEDRWVFLHAGEDAHDRWFVVERESLSESPALRAIGRRALDRAGVGAGDLAFVDLYSCFPCAPRIAAEMLGIDEDRDLTVTGGLPYFGGPGNDYSLHAIATIVERLRESPDSFGLVSALGWYLTKHSIGVYSTRAPERPWNRSEDASLRTEIEDGESPRLDPEPNGRGVVETYTVLHDRDGAPIRGIVVGRLDTAGDRFVANTPDDRDVLEAMEREETIGRRGTVSPGETNLFRI